MPSSLPSGADQHVNQLLSDLSVGFVQSDSKFISRRAFPVVSVAKQSGKYAEFDRGDFLRDEAERRAPGTESAGGGYRVSQSSFDAAYYAFHKDVADQDRRLADDPFRPDADAAVWLAQKALIREERQFMTDFFTTSVWTGSSSGSDLVAGTDFTAWDDDTSDPIGNVADEAAEVESNTGLLPNKLIVNRRGWKALKNHPDIVDRVKHTSAASITTDTVAALMDLDEILVAAGVHNSADEGATVSADYIAGDHALLVYAPESPGMYLPSAGYTFLLDGIDNGMTVSSFRMEHLKSDRHEIEWAFDQVLVSGVLGVFFQNVVS